MNLASTLYRRTEQQGCFYCTISAFERGVAVGILAKAAPLFGSPLCLFLLSVPIRIQDVNDAFWKIKLRDCSRVRSLVTVDGRQVFK